MRRVRVTERERDGENAVSPFSPIGSQAFDLHDSVKLINLARINSPTFGFYPLKRLSVALETLFGSLSPDSSDLHFAPENRREATVIFFLFFCTVLSLTVRWSKFTLLRECEARHFEWYVQMF